MNTVTAPIVVEKPVRGQITQMPVPPLITSTVTTPNETYKNVTTITRRIVPRPAPQLVMQESPMDKCKSIGLVGGLALLGGLLIWSLITLFNKPGGAVAGGASGAGTPIMITKTKVLNRTCGNYARVAFNSTVKTGSGVTNTVPPVISNYPSSVQTKYGLAPGEAYDAYGNVVRTVVSNTFSPFTPAAAEYYANGGKAAQTKTVTTTTYLSGLPPGTDAATLNASLADQTIYEEDCEEVGIPLPPPVVPKDLIAIPKALEPIAIATPKTNITVNLPPPIIPVVKPEPPPVVKVEEIPQEELAKYFAFLIEQQYPATFTTTTFTTSNTTTITSQPPIPNIPLEELARYLAYLIELQYPATYTTTVFSTDFLQSVLAPPANPPNMTGINIPPEELALYYAYLFEKQYPTYVTTTTYTNGPPIVTTSVSPPPSIQPEELARYMAYLVEQQYPATATTTTFTSGPAITTQTIAAHPAPQILVAQPLAAEQALTVQSVAVQPNATQITVAQPAAAEIIVSQPAAAQIPEDELARYYAYLLEQQSSALPNITVGAVAAQPNLTVEVVAAQPNIAVGAVAAQPEAAALVVQQPVVTLGSELPANFAIDYGLGPASDQLLVVANDTNSAISAAAALNSQLNNLDPNSLISISANQIGADYSALPGTDALIANLTDTFAAAAQDSGIATLASTAPASGSTTVLSSAAGAAPKAGFFNKMWNSINGLRSPQKSRRLSHRKKI